MMGLSRVRSDSDKQGKNQIPHTPNGNKLGVQKSIFGASSDFDMLVWLRGAALDPCSPQTSHNSQKVHNQAIKTWKFLLMNNDECPRRKRKLELYLKDSNHAASSKSSVEKSNNQHAKKVPSISSVSHSLNSFDGTTTFNQSIISGSLTSRGMMIIEDNFQGKQVTSNITFLDKSRICCLSGTSFSTLAETDVLVHGSNSSSPENPIVLDGPSVDLDDSVHDPDSLSSGIYMTPQQAVELLITTGECPPRPVVPVGPRFQAELPEWGGSTTKKITNSGDGDSENLRWLGTQSWPTKGANTHNTNLKAVGAGRQDTCSCTSPGSVECIKLHVSQARRLLQSDLGSAFLSWKFNEMGEDVSKSWTLKEQEKFESLVKTNPLTNGEDFWEYAVEIFPSKSKKTLLKYYYNVFIPRRMSTETRSSKEQVESDEDQVDDSDDEEAEEGGGHNRVQRLLKCCKS